MIGDILSSIGQNESTLGVPIPECLSPAMAGRSVFEQNTLSGSSGQGLDSKHQIKRTTCGKWRKSGSWRRW